MNAIRGYVCRVPFQIRNWLYYRWLKIAIIWIRFLRWRWTFTKSGFLIVAMLLIFIGIGLGMACRAHQVEPRLNAEIAYLNDSLNVVDKQLDEWVGRAMMFEAQLKHLQKKMASADVETSLAHD